MIKCIKEDSKWTFTFFICLPLKWIWEVTYSRTRHSKYWWNHVKSQFKLTPAFQKYVIYLNVPIAISEAGALSPSDAFKGRHFLQRGMLRGKSAGGAQPASRSHRGAGAPHQISQVSSGGWWGWRWWWWWWAELFFSVRSGNFHSYSSSSTSSSSPGVSKAQEHADIPEWRQAPCK